MPFHFSKIPLVLGILPFTLFASASRTSDTQLEHPHAAGGTWTPLHNQPSFTAAHALLLTDGSVMCQELETGNWYRLRPDQFGSYVNGSWSPMAAMPSGYAPLYYASAVLADGRVVIAGGEYNSPPGPTNLAAIYNPKSDRWSPLAAPPGWANIADASSTVLPDKRWMLSDAYSSDTASLDPRTLTWTILSPNGKADSNDEEGWTLLPDGTVLTADIANFPNSERYFPAMNTWVSAGSTGVPLTDFSSYEIGPAVLRPDGSVFYTGTCPVVNELCTGPAHTAIYRPPANPYGLGSWEAGPDFPDGLDVADGPASILPDGNVLVMASPGEYQIGAVFFEFDGEHLTQVAAPATAGQVSSYFGNMLVLPTGQILLTSFSNDVEIYTPAGRYREAWRPCIRQAPVIVHAGGTYKISGTQFNGVSLGAAYGDDAQMNTNYPLVRFSNIGKRGVSYWRTHDHSTMGVATGQRSVFTYVDVPKNAPLGVGFIAVVANGIPSEPWPVVVLPDDHAPKP